jgi:hypothetical protein
MHRWVERYSAGLAGKAQQEFHVRIFPDLLDGFLISQAKPLLDEQRTERGPHRLHGSTSRVAELRGICFFQLLRRPQRGEHQPVIVRIQSATKRHMKLVFRELSVMVFPVHLQRSAVTAIDDCSVCRHNISFLSLEPVAQQWF